MEQLRGETVIRLFANIERCCNIEPAQQAAAA